MQDLDDLTDELLLKGLSKRSAVYVHATLRKVFNYAIRRGLLQNTPYRFFDMPRPEEFHYTVLNEKQIAAMLKDAECTDLEIPIRLALRYGMRRGEVLGLQPNIDLNLSDGTLHIQRTRTEINGKPVITPCKTKSSNRFLLLAPEDAELLSLVVGLYACPLTTIQLNKRFKRFLCDYGFPDMRFHDLRHSYATLMLAKGVNPKIVSTVLGHSDTGITLDIYSHPDVRMQSFCLDALKPS